MRGNVHICKSDKFVPVLLHMNFSVTLAYEADYVIVTHRDIVRFICKSKKKESGPIKTSLVPKCSRHMQESHLKKVKIVICYSCI